MSSPLFIESIIPLNNTYNTRTIGYIKTLNGLKIKPNVLFRSDNLSSLDNNDLEILSSLGIKKIVDFRSVREKSKEPDILPKNIVYDELPIEADKNIRKEINDILNGNNTKDMKSFLIQANHDFVLEYTPTFSKFIKNFIKYHEPTLFHCTSGKDRTGFASALILSILNVDRKTIYEEYLFSNYCIDKNLDKQVEKISIMMNITKEECLKLKPLLRVDIVYIKTAFKTIDNIYGSIENYIKNGLCITNEEILKLKNIMLEF
jgi:protein-tyrosine phosphatase